MQIALLVCLLYGATAKTRVGKHHFPRLTPHGFETANEFQMILPENIVDRRRSVNGYTIKDISPLVINNDGVVSITYTSSSPSSSDWIGAYSPANVNISETSPVKYGWCDEADTYIDGGEGLLTFNLTNLRADVVFYYFTNSLSSPVLVASSEQKVSFANVNEPLRPRVVATGDINVLNLLWSSAVSTTPKMKWGTISGVYDTVVDAATTSIPQSSMCGAPASTYGWRELGLIHTAPFIGMKSYAGSKLYYIFGDDSTQDYSKEHVLFVPPNPGSTVIPGSTENTVRPTRAILFDDLGRGSTDMTYTWNEYGRPAIYTIQAVGAEVAAGAVDVIYHGGDISYATGYTAVWDFYLDLLAPVAGSALYLTTVGNHESDWYNSASIYNQSDSGGECGVCTVTLLPQPAPATVNEPWWSYEVGMIHFIGISTEHDYTIGSKQYLWLENDLRNVDRSITPWIVFGGHRAMYLNSDYSGNSAADVDVMDNMIANLEPLLFKYRVNIGFYGHNHVVQRQSAVYNKTVVQASTPVTDEDGKITYLHTDPQATVHMVVGTGGASFTVNAVTPPPDWNEMFMYEYGYARVVAVNATYLDWQWVLSSTGEVLDHMVVTQTTDFTQSWVLPPNK